MPVSADISIGTEAAQPENGSFTVSVDHHHTFFSVEIVLTAAEVPVIDADASGSYGTLALFEFNEDLDLIFISSVVRFTEVAEGVGLTGAGDAIYTIAIGSTPMDAAEDNTIVGTDFALTDDPIAAASTSGTLADPIASVGLLDEFQVRGDGKGIYLNWSGSASSVDANGTVAVTGKVVITGSFAD